MASPTPAELAAARAANAEIRTANAGLATLRARALGLAGDLAGPMIMVARGASVSRAALEGIKGAIIGRVLGPIGIVSGAAIGLLGTIKALTNVFSRAGVEARASLERMEKGFQPLLKSAAAARTRVKDLVDFTKTSPFRLASVAAANKSLEYLTRGALSGREGMKLVGDAAAASGTDFEEAAFSIGRLYEGIQAGTPIERAGTRLEWMGLISMGTAKRLDALQQSGASAGEVWRVMETELRRSAGGMAMMSASLEAMRSKLEMTEQVASAAFGEPFMEGQQAEVQATTKAIEGMTPAARELGEILSVLPNAWSRVKAAVLGLGTTFEAVTRGVTGAAIALGILALTIAGITASRILGAVAGLFQLGAGAKAAADAAKSLAAVRGLLALATARLAAGETALAMSTYRTAGVQALAAARANGLAVVLRLLWNGVTMLAGVVGGMLRAAMAAVLTPFGLVLSAAIAAVFGLHKVSQGFREAGDAARSSQEKMEAHTATLNEMVRTMLTAEDAARAQASAIKEVSDAEAEAAAARSKYRGGSLWKTALHDLFGVGEDEMGAADARVAKARQKARDTEARLASGNVGVSEEDRQARLKASQQELGERFYEGVTYEQAQAEWEAKRETQKAMLGAGPGGGMLRALTNERDLLRGTLAGRASAGMDTSGLAEELDAANRKVFEERRRLAKESASEEMRAGAALAEDDDRLDLQRRADLAQNLFGKVQVAYDAKDMGALANQADDVELREALRTGNRGRAVTRAGMLAGLAASEAAAAGPSMGPQERQAAQDAKDKARAKYDLETNWQRKVRDQEAAYDAQRAAGEKKIAAVRDEGLDAAMAELNARRDQLDLEESIAEAKKKAGQMSEAELTAARARIQVSREELATAERMERVRAEYSTRRAVAETKAGMADTQAAAARRQGNHAAADALEIRAQEERFAARKLELDREALSMDEATLRAQGYRSRDDYVAKTMAGERAAWWQQRGFGREDIALQRRAAMAETESGIGGLEADALRLSGQGISAKEQAEAAARITDETRRTELKNRFMRELLMSETDATSAANREIKKDQAVRMLQAMNDERGTVVASSLAAIGGGGGVYGVDPSGARLDMANRFLKEIRDNTKANVTNKFG